jgi:hypothetical protein
MPEAPYGPLSLEGVYNKTKKNNQRKITAEN